MSAPRFAFRLAAVSIALALGCGGKIDGNAGATGAGGDGATGAGGASSTGNGGATGSGGAGSGGAGSGGATGTGGATGSGGSAAGGSGGASGAGGTAGAGGASGAGGATGAGGAAGAGPFKGVANTPNCGDLTKLSVTWYYNWTTTPFRNCTTSAEFVPMVAGKSEKTGAAVTSAINAITSAGYKTVLGFNEPNKMDQSNLTVAEVVGMWPQLTANAALRVGSPATSADGQSWFNDFMTQVSTQNLRVDFIALHWYGWNAGSCDAKASQLEGYIKWAEGLPGNRPIWLTEWGCLNASEPDVATVQAFYTGALAVFAKHPRVERYAWYPWDMNNKLFDSADALTSLGTALASAPATR